jgi:glycosyltransferase involved in cell wall biosynthesis
MKDSAPNPVVSVILPVYNGEKFLREAIDSMLSQTFRDFELIIVDDGSTDRSGEIIRSYDDKRIVRVGHIGNQGLVASLNSAIRLAKGQLIARMDADDVALPHRLAKQVEVFHSHPSVCVTGTNYFFLDGGRKRSRHFAADNDYLKALLLFATCFSHPTVMMRNVFRELNIYYDGAFRHVEDYKLWTDLSGAGDFHFIEEPLLVYRHHSHQVTAKNREAQFEQSAKIRRSYLDKLGFRYSESQMVVHNLVGDNTKITFPGQLDEVESWLMELLKQNSKMKRFEASSFNRLIHQYWIDCCGNTSLGMIAYRAALRSPLAALGPVSMRSRFRLAAKCILRKSS